MDCSFPRICTACGQENGVGFRDGQWCCDSCLERHAISDGLGKPQSSRRIFTASAVKPPHAHTDIFGHSPPLGEHAAQAVMEDRKPRKERLKRKPFHDPIMPTKGGKRKKRASRSQRFSKRRKSWREYVRCAGRRSMSPRVTGNKTFSSTTPPSTAARNFSSSKSMTIRMGDAATAVSPYRKRSSMTEVCRRRERVSGGFHITRQHLPPRRGTTLSLPKARRSPYPTREPPRSPFSWQAAVRRPPS